MPATPPQSSKPRLLFVDDEKRVLNSMRAMFRREYELFLTTRGDEAIKIISEHPIDVVVCDQRMPIMSGIEVLTAIKERSPATVRILLTGYSDLDAIEGAMNDGEVFRFLNKPCAATELRGTISEAAEIARSTASSVRAANTALSDEAHTKEVEALSDQGGSPNLQNVVAEQAKRNGKTHPAAQGEIRMGSSPSVNAEAPLTTSPASDATDAPVDTQADTSANTFANDDDEAGSLEIVMSGDTITVVDHREDAPPGARPAAPVVAPAPEPVEPVPTLQPPNRITCLGQGKYNISIMVFSPDDQFARSIGRSLQGLFYTFHATNAVRLMEGIANIAPAVLITDVSTEPEIIENLTGMLKQKVPALVTLVAGQHRDGSVMINLINHGQVFRFIDKPLSSTACQKHVREAIRRHIMLRKNPKLAQRYAVREKTGASGKWRAFSASVATRLQRVRRLWGLETDG